MLAPSVRADSRSRRTSDPFKFETQVAIFSMYLLGGPGRKLQRRVGGKLAYQVLLKRTLRPLRLHGLHRWVIDLDVPTQIYLRLPLRPAWSLA